MSIATNITETYTELTRGERGTITKGVLLFSLLAILPVLLELSLFGFSLGKYFSVEVLIITLVWAYTAQSWNIMSGFTGQFSFGHAAFFGIGAYATQKLLIDATVNPWIGMLIGAIVAMFFGIMIGFLTFRYDLKGHYFALATLAFAELVRFTIKNLGELNGANGFFKPFPQDYGMDYGLAAFQFQSNLPYYYIILSFLIIVTTVAWFIKNSWVGLYFFAIREDEYAASSVGVPAFQYKMLGIALSAFFVAWGGTFWSMYFNTIRPDTVTELFVNVEILLPAVIGGLGTLYGPIVGSFVVTPISEVARTTFDNINGLDRIIYGVFLVVIVIYSPRGVVNWPARARELVRSILDKDKKDDQSLLNQDEKDETNTIEEA